MTPTDASSTRPRVEGDREGEILDAALAVLAEVGYDRLTMDAVAGRARSSKATLYRRWGDKVTLVIEAIQRLKGPRALPDTGSLRGDLLALHCGNGGVTDPQTLAVTSSVVTAVGHDPEFAAAFRTRVVEPKVALARAVWDRALARGELRADVDLDIFQHALAGMVLHRTFVLGLPPDDDVVARIVDQVVLPAAQA